MLQLGTDKQLYCSDIGLISYRNGLALQGSLHELRKSEAIGDTVLFLEHPNVLTLGTRGSMADVLISETEINARKIEVFRSNRGGQVTFHGPGQLVVYFIFNLYQAQRDLRKFVETMEECLIDFLRLEYGIESKIDPGFPGVWVENKKIAAVGISVKDRVTMHGFALNINADLSMFSTIIPCGIRDRGVTSLQKLLSETLKLSDVKTCLAQYIMRHFGFSGIKWGAVPESITTHS